MDTFQTLKTQRWFEFRIMISILGTVDFFLRIFSRTIWRVMRMIFTIKTSTCISAWNPSIKALTILFLTLWFFTNTAFPIFPIIFGFDLNFRLCEKMLMRLIIMASKASTLLGAHFPSRKTLTVTFETICFGTCTPSFLLLGRHPHRNILLLL